MTDLFLFPGNYGFDDVQIPVDGDSYEPSSGGEGFGARIYYPTEEIGTRNARIRSGPYPLVIFAHGDRSGTPIFGDELCPRDFTQDYKRWGSMLSLMARCGFVVVVPAMHDVLGGSSLDAERLEAVARWMYHHWPYRSTVTYPLQAYIERPVTTATRKGAVEEPRYDAAEVHRYEIVRNLPAELLNGFGPDIAVPIGNPAPLGLIGHSWGMKACCEVAARGNVHVSSLAAVAGTFDDNEAPANFVQANVPTFLLCGTGDFQTFGYLPGLWRNTPAPKHQAAIRDLGHWDWFGPAGGIQPCDDDVEPPACNGGARMGSVMLLAFEKRYLGGWWYSSPNLLDRPGNRPPFDFSDDGPCALAVRWEAPTLATPAGAAGSQELGQWDGNAPW
jgi:pimeloyl-ACP methyl ester carboxylesterase